MEVRRIGCRLEFEGILDEHSRFEPIKEAWMAAAAEAGEHGSVQLDFSEVKKCNSVGLLGYARILHEIVTHVEYVNVPVWLVDQFNSVSELLPVWASVHSVQLRFYCPSQDTMHLRTLEIGKDLPVKSDYTGFEIHCKSEDGFELEPDFDPEIAFSFIAHLALKQEAAKR